MRHSYSFGIYSCRKDGHRFESCSQSIKSDLLILTLRSPKLEPVSSCHWYGDRALIQKGSASLPISLTNSPPFTTTVLGVLKPTLAATLSCTNLCSASRLSPGCGNTRHPAIR